MSSPIPLLNCVIYGYATALPRGFFNQDRFIKTRAADADSTALVAQLITTYEPIVADRVRGAANLMGEANKLSNILAGQVPTCDEYSLSGYAPWEEASYRIAKHQLLGYEAPRIAYLFGYDTGAFFATMSFCIMILDFCLDAGYDGYALARQMMAEQDKLYTRIQSYCSHFWMLPQPIYSVEDIFWKEGMEPSYKALVAANPTTREQWESYFNQLKNASLLLDQKFGDTIKSLM